MHLSFVVLLTLGLTCVSARPLPSLTPEQGGVLAPVRGNPTASPSQKMANLATNKLNDEGFTNSEEIDEEESGYTMPSLTGQKDVAQVSDISGAVTPVGGVTKAVIHPINPHEKVLDPLSESMNTSDSTSFGNIVQVPLTRAIVKDSIDQASFDPVQSDFTSNSGGKIVQVPLTRAAKGGKDVLVSAADASVLPIAPVSPLISMETDAKSAISSTPFNAASAEAAPFGSAPHDQNTPQGSSTPPFFKVGPPVHQPAPAVAADFTIDPPMMPGPVRIAEDSNLPSQINGGASTLASSQKQSFGDITEHAENTPTPLFNQPVETGPNAHSSRPNQVQSSDTELSKDNTADSNSAQVTSSTGAVVKAPVSLAEEETRPIMNEELTVKLAQIESALLNIKMKCIRIPEIVAGGNASMPIDPLVQECYDLVHHASDIAHPSDVSTPVSTPGVNFEVLTKVGGEMPQVVVGSASSSNTAPAPMDVYEIF